MPVFLHGDQLNLGRGLLQIPSDTSLETIVNDVLTAGYDYITVPLATKESQKASSEPFVPAMTCDLALPGRLWGSCMIAQCTEGLNPDLDTYDEHRRDDRNSKRLEEEISFGEHLGATALLLPFPDVSGCVQFAALVNRMLLKREVQGVPLVIQVPLVYHDKALHTITTKAGNKAIKVDGWTVWNQFKQLIECRSDLRVSLIIDVAKFEKPTDLELDRWYGERVHSVQLASPAFLKNSKKYPVLPKKLQSFVKGFFTRAETIFIVRDDERETSGERWEEDAGLNGGTTNTIVPFPIEKTEGSRSSSSSVVNTGDSELDTSTSLSPVKNARFSTLQARYLSLLFKSRSPPDVQQKFERPFLDVLQAPLQPLHDHLGSQTYETFEEDPVKYVLYQEAVTECLWDKIRFLIDSLKKFSGANLFPGVGASTAVMDPQVALRIATDAVAELVKERTRRPAPVPTDHAGREATSEKVEDASDDGSRLSDEVFAGKDDRQTQDRGAATAARNNSRNADADEHHRTQKEAGATRNADPEELAEASRQPREEAGRGEIESKREQARVLFVKGCNLSTICTGENSFVIMVVGAGRGPIVQACLDGIRQLKKIFAKAAVPDEHQPEFKLIAVEKNPNAVHTLLYRNKYEWCNQVEIVGPMDMRDWKTEYKADVIVSELLGSFSDNELSPECLDGAQRFLRDEDALLKQLVADVNEQAASKRTTAHAQCDHRGINVYAPTWRKVIDKIFCVVMESTTTSGDKEDNTSAAPAAATSARSSTHLHARAARERSAMLFLRKNIRGTSIPQSYTSSLQLVASPANHNMLKSRQQFEQGYVVAFQHLFCISAPQPCFTFEHPSDRVDGIGHNDRHCQITFKPEVEAECDGLAAYFDCVLYEATCEGSRKIRMSIDPVTKTEDLISWFPMYFPFKQPFQLSPLDSVQVNVWRKSDKAKVWYEWACTDPIGAGGGVHNAGGRFYSIYK